ncbi:MAG: hypothetical protein ACI86H_000986 [bacterium]|jgi:hypothetical protein
MDSPDLYTITVIKNVSAPLSFTVRSWKLRLSIVLLVISILTFSFFTAFYFVQKEKNEKLKRTLVTVEEKLDRMKNLLARRDHDQFQSGTSTKQSKEKVKGVLTQQKKFSPKGLWNSSSSLDSLRAENVLHASAFKPYLKGKKLYLPFRLSNLSKPYRVIGCYLFITLTNRDKTPAIYRSVSERAVLGENGFPKNYKSGYQYYFQRQKQRKITKSVTTGVGEYYTEATIFLYSYKGQLIGKQTFRNLKKLFVE